MITAPPPAKAVNMCIKSKFKVSTRETPDTADSPVLETIMESNMPTVIASSCSMNKGIIIFIKSVLEKILTK